MTNGAIPWWMAFLVGPVLLTFAVWTLPARIKKARQQMPVRQISAAKVSDAFDAWFPSLWAAGVGAFGAIFVLGGLLRLAGLDQ